MTTQKLPIEKLISDTDKMSKRLRENPNCKETATAYEKIKEELRESLVGMRVALEAINSNDE